MEEKNTLEMIGDVTLGTMTFGNQNTGEAHEQLAFACKEFGVRAIDTAEMCTRYQRMRRRKAKLTSTSGRWLKRQKREDFVVMTKWPGGVRWH